MSNPDSPTFAPIIDPQEQVENAHLEAVRRDQEGLQRQLTEISRGVSVELPDVDPASRRIIQAPFHRESSSSWTIPSGAIKKMF